jgi:hypothetical protein
MFINEYTEWYGMHMGRCRLYLSAPVGPTTLKWEPPHAAATKPDHIAVTIPYCNLLSIVLDILCTQET